MAPYIAGKTGTTDGENDVWFVGFSNEVTVAVWVGYDNADGNRRTLGSGRTGGNLATSVFEPIMQAVWSHHSPKTALRLPSPEAQRSLAAVSKGYGKTSKGLLPELLRRDARGRTLDAQYRLVSRSEHDVYVAAKVARSQPPQENSYAPSNVPDGRNAPWFGGGGWGDSPRWENDGGRGRGGRW
jgi:penicillin-binding protein 1A